MSKKIGILTFHTTTNYGAILQAFALEKKIIELGYDCEIINYHGYIEYKEFFKFPKFEKNIINYLKNIRYYFIFLNKRKPLRKFINQNIILSEKDYDKKNISLSNNVYDKIIVGSDMVFNLVVTKYDTTYLLDFANNSKKFSYAASLGINKIDDKDLDLYKNNLNSFRYLSVREIQTQEYLNTILENDVNIDIDPTLLYDSTFWEKFEEKPSQLLNKKYIVLYFIDPEGVELETALKIAEEKDYQIIILGNLKKNGERFTCISNASIGEFLYYIHYAELVITASYHGMLFSMNYNTNFMYYNKSNSPRLESIAKLTDTMDRRLTKTYIPEIEFDFNNTNKLISDLRNKSIKNLKKILESNDK